MSNQDELDAITQTRGTCPICAEDGKTLRRQMHGLASHLMKEHTVDELVYQIAGEAVLAALDEEEQPKFAEGGIVTGPGGLVGGTGCVITFDPRVQKVFTAEDFKTPEAQAALEKMRLAVRSRPSAINTNDFESFPPKDPAAMEFETELRRAIKESD